MELTAGVLIAIVVVAVALGLALSRSWQHRDATPPPLVTPSRNNPLATPDERQEQALINWLLSRAFEQTGVRVAEDPMACQRIEQAAQTALRELRSQPSATISLPFLTADAHGPKHFEVRVTRNTLREIAP